MLATMLVIGATVVAIRRRPSFSADGVTTPPIAPLAARPSDTTPTITARRGPYCECLTAAKSWQQRVAGNRRTLGNLTAVVAVDARAEIVERLRDGGMRITRPRRMVIDALVRGPAPHDGSRDRRRVRADDPEFYESTVYRILDRLLELGIVERVQLGPGGAVFHLPHRPHHHPLCQRCGDVVEIPASLLDDLAAQLHAQHGFRLRPTASTLVGSCARCDETGADRHLTSRAAAWSLRSSLRLLPLVQHRDGVRRTWLFGWVPRLKVRDDPEWARPSNCELTRTSGSSHCDPWVQSPRRVAVVGS